MHPLKVIIFNKRYRRRAGVCCIVALVLFYCIQRFDSHKLSHYDKSIAVGTAVVTTMDVPIYVTALGTVIPEKTVTATAQVNGRLNKILFQDGQEVKAGQALAEIDSKPYEAALAQSEGQLVRDTALLANAKLDLQRYRALWKQNSVSEQVVDTQASLVTQYEGVVELDKGLVDSARVNLSYCFITSPIDGHVGLHLIDEGNVVQTAGNTGIVVINTLNPITVIFSVPENELSTVLAEWTKNRSIDAIAYDRELKKPLSNGKLLAIDNQIDPTTGTVKLKAVFKNDERTLFPNQFVNIKLLLNTLKDAIVVPIAAVQRGKSGNFVYKVDSDNKVHTTFVDIGATYNHHVVITSGLLQGDVVVVDGVDKLTDGASVQSDQHEQRGAKPSTPATTSSSAPISMIQVEPKTQNFSIDNSIKNDVVYWIRAHARNDNENY